MSSKYYGDNSPYHRPDYYSSYDYEYNQYIRNKLLNNARKPYKRPLVAALFGVGRVGSIHLSNIVHNPGVNLKYIIQEDASVFVSLKEFWSLTDQTILLTSKDAEKVYQDKEVNVVFIASPTETHYDIIINSLENDKDVFCEVPVTKNAADTKKCYEVAESKNRILFAAFNRRFDPSYEDIKQQTRCNVVGNIHILKVTSRDSSVPIVDYLKTSGGVFHDCLVHDIDIACWIVEDRPIRVQATATALIPEVRAIGDFDTVGLLLTFPSGAVVMCDYSRHCSYGFDQRLEVFGSEGMMKAENERPCHSLETYIDVRCVQKTPIFHSFPSRYKVAYAREVNHFFDVVQKRKNVGVQSWQTIAVTKIATAAEKSARTGKTVHLDWFDDELEQEYA